MTVRTACGFIHDGRGDHRRALVRGGAAPQLVPDPGQQRQGERAQVCAADFEASVKPIAKWQREQALERYGRRPEDFTGELDHLIPVSLGGTNDPDDIWPLPANKDMGPDQKKELELKLHWSAPRPSS
jgi:hypothetical protein